MDASKPSTLTATRRGTAQRTTRSGCRQCGRTTFSEALRSSRNMGSHWRWCQEGRASNLPCIVGSVAAVWPYAGMKRATNHMLSSPASLCPGTMSGLWATARTRWFTCSISPLAASSSWCTRVPSLCTHLTPAHAPGKSPIRQGCGIRCAVLLPNTREVLLGPQLF